MTDFTRFSNPLATKATAARVLFPSEMSLADYNRFAAALRREGLQGSLPRLDTTVWSANVTTSRPLLVATFKAKVLRAWEAVFPGSYLPELGELVRA